MRTKANNAILWLMREILAALRTLLMMVFVFTIYAMAPCYAQNPVDQPTKNGATNLTFADYINGKRDGRIVGRQQTSEPSWILLGVFTGGLAFFASPFYGLDVPAEKIPPEKTGEYLTGFMEGFKGGKRDQQMLMCGFGVVMIASLVLLMGQ